MEQFLESSNGFFGWLWRTSWQAAIVTMLVLVAQRLLGRRLTPRWRYALWFLVVIRLTLPASIESRVSLFNFFNAPSFSAFAGATDTAVNSATPGEGRLTVAKAAHKPDSHFGHWAKLRSVWLAGALLLWGYFLASAWLIGRTVRKERLVTNELVLNLLEDCKQEMGVTTPLALIETARVKSPALLGFIRPRLLLPTGLIQNFSLQELRFVFLHELGHLKRGDILLNWLLTLPLVFHWFNPLVWYALLRMRVDGEAACDALALSHAREGENQLYGQTIIKLLERFSSPAPTPGLLGMLESGNQMKRRIGMIARFRKTESWPLLAVSLFAILSLLTLTDALSQSPTHATERQAGNNGEQAHWRPWVIASSPAIGDSSVDPATGEVAITFDRDMSTGMSWTGRDAEFPPSPEGQKAYWRNARTCVLPVKLEAGSYYRVDINTYHQNFRGTDGRAAAQCVVYFTTRGASRTTQAKLTKPGIVRLSPPNGAVDVDPNLKEITVTFDLPMTKGYSWAGGGEHYPGEEVKTAYWLDEHTCVLPVALKPDHRYDLWVNSESAVNFQSEDGGVPAEPVNYTFKTKLAN